MIGRSRHFVPPAFLEHHLVERAYAQAILMLLPLNAVYWSVSGRTGESDFYGLMNFAGPVCFVPILCLLSFRVLRGMPGSIWTAAFWFPVQSAILFGFGPLVEVLGNEITRAFLSTGNLAVTADQLFRANKLSTTGITLLLIGFWCHLRSRAPTWKRILGGQNSSPAFSPKLVAVGFVILGGALKYLLFKPAQWGELDLVVPGVVSGLDTLIDVGFGIIGFLAARGSKSMRWLFILAWPAHFFLCILSFAKVEIVIAMLLPLIGAYVGRRKLRNLVIGLALMAPVYMAAEPWVHYGRETVYAETGTISQAGYARRVQILESYIFSDIPYSASADQDARQAWWTRLNYAGPQAYAMQLHDLGITNHSLDDVWMYFVPRTFWPDKPIIVGPALDFYRQVTGDPEGQSFLGLSIYGDLYWQFGWPGVLIGCTLVGWLFAMLAARSIRAIENREFIMLPAVLLAMKMALIGTSDFVVSGIVGPLPIYVAYVLLFELAARFVTAKRSLRLAVIQPPGGRHRHPDGRFRQNGSAPKALDRS